VTITAKPDVKEFENQLESPDRVREMTGNGQMGAFVKDYADAKIQMLGEDINRQVKDQMDSTMGEWLKEHGGKVSRPGVATEQKPRENRMQIAQGKGAMYNHRAPGALIDNDDSRPEDFTEFLQAIWHHRNTLANSDELDAKRDKWKKIQNSFGSVVPADGGFLIPEELRSDLLQIAVEDSLVRSRAQVIPMSSLAVPIPSVDETSRVSSLFGGVIAYWTEEGAAITESQARFGNVRLEAKKLVIYCEAPNELIADAPAFSSFISNNIPRALAFEEDYAFLQGSGVGQPLGVLKGSGLINTTRSATTGINFTDVIRVFTRLLPGSYSNAVWLVAPDSVGDLLALVNAGGTTPIWLGGPYGQGAAGAPPMTLLGRPVYVTEKVPANDATNDLSLIDFSHYLIGDRQIIQASSSPHFKFSSDKTAYKILERVDGRPWVQTALTPRNNSSSTLSPYVAVGPT
jgi:HK97 family phage major capsid protein